ncbi:MAG: PDZ domain-containing protein [Candidatus Polarisedimenticolia bacterium]
MRSHAARAALALILVVWPGALARAEAQDPSAAWREIFREHADRVVGVTYVLRPREKPTGGEGRRVENAECGLIVNDEGLVVIPADPFPEPGGDPRTTLAPVEFKVHVRGGRPIDAKPVGLDNDLNLAFLRLDRPPKGLKPLRFDSSARVDVGDRVLVIGLMARRYDYAPVLYTAMVSAVVEKPRRMYSLDLMVQDLSIGGLVLAQDGRAIGIVGEDVLDEPPVGDRSPGNTLSLIGSLTQGQRVGYPMVFPHTLFASSLAAPPSIAEQERRSWMGIIMQPLGDDLISYWKLDAEGGVIISSVVEGSPAEKAGLRTSDIIVAMQGEPLRLRKEEDLPDLRRRIERIGVGRSIDVDYLREGVRHTASLTLAEAPLTAFSAQEIEDDDLGFTIRQITIDDILSQNLDPATSGVVVSELEQAGFAQLAGLRPGDIVQGIDGRTVQDIESFRHELERLRAEKPGGTLFFVLRQTDTLFVRLKTPWTKPRS